MQTGLPTKDSLNGHVIVTGANGFIGRWLITALTRKGATVIALLRKAASRVDELRSWVTAHGGDGTLIEARDFDLGADDLGLDQDTRNTIQSASVVYHLAARFGFNLDVETTRKMNVEAAVGLIMLCADNRALKRFVHISGYRTEGSPAQAFDVDDAGQVAAFYRDHGAYEASKMEAHTLVARAAARHDVPLTRVSPAMVIGDSQTGETTQFTGLAETLGLMWRGRLPALVGTPHTWMPAVTVDTLARLLAALPEDPESAGEHYVVFDDHTPALPQLLELAASRMDVDAPAHLLPVGLVSRLPKTWTGVEPESLSFISDDRYDPTPVRRLMTRLNLTFPPFEQSMAHWVDFLIDTRFGERPSHGASSFHAAGTRVWARGPRRTAGAVFCHGLMLNEHSWGPVTDALNTQTLALDLPGLGRSAPGGGTPAEWLRAVLSPTEAPPVIVGHSLGTAFAVGYASAYPDRVKALVLVSPFFLQPRPGWALRQPWLTRNVFRFAGADRLTTSLDGPIDDARGDALDLLGRPTVSRESARWLAWAASRSVRERLRQQLAALEVPATLIVGSNDPLVFPVPDGVRVIDVQGAGHHPQLTHSAVVAEAVAAAIPSAD